MTAILSFSHSYQISDSIWWQRKLPSETVYEPLPAIFDLYEIWWKSSTIPTNTTVINLRHVISDKQGYKCHRNNKNRS